MKNIVLNIGSSIKISEDFVESEKSKNIVQMRMNKRRQQKELYFNTKIFTSHEIRIKRGIQKLFEKDKKPISLLHDNSSVLMK